MLLGKREQNFLLLVIIIFSLYLLILQIQHNRSIPKPNINISTFSSDNETKINFPLDLNQVSYDELKQINGLSSELAEAIITYRENNGSFTNLEQLKEIDGISSGLVKHLEIYLIVGND